MMMMMMMMMMMIAITDDDDDNKLFLWNGWPTKGIYALFPPENTVRDSHRCKSPNRREQDLSLRRAWVQTSLNEVVQSRWPLHHSATTRYCNTEKYLIGISKGKLIQKNNYREWNF